MNKYKLIAIDIDGTLLTNSKEILNQTKIDINKAFENGIVICICTGRGYPAAKRYIDELNLNIPLILYNGAIIKMSNSDNLILNKTINDLVSVEVFNTITKNNGTCCFWANDILYFNKYDQYTKYYEELTGIKAIIVENFTIDNIVNINKFLWFDTPENLEYIKKNVMNSVDGVDCFKSQKVILEIVPTNVNKGEAIKFLANYYNIDISEVIAIGDDENDMSMISVAGLGVAMGNAKECVKEIADYITVSNEENGVGTIINEFIL